MHQSSDEDSGLIVQFQEQWDLCQNQRRKLREIHRRNSLGSGGRSSVAKWMGGVERKASVWGKHIYILWSNNILVSPPWDTNEVCFHLNVAGEHLLSIKNCHVQGHLFPEIWHETIPPANVWYHYDFSSSFSFSGVEGEVNNLPSNYISSFKVNLKIDYMIIIVDSPLLSCLWTLLSACCAIMQRGLESGRTSTPAVVGIFLAGYISPWCRAPARDSGQQPLLRHDLCYP